MFDAVATIVGYGRQREEDRWSKQRRTEEEGGEQNREENRGITLAVPGAGKTPEKGVAVVKWSP